jgi:DNA-binding HxlR family transcriptional regulator
VARALEVVGERWTLLIVRDALLGIRRFEDFQRDLGIARNVLTDRLGRLVDVGVLERVAYSEKPPRHEYRLTDKGLDLWPVVHALADWGNQHDAPNGPPVLFTHRGCGGELDDRRRCTRCGQDVTVREAKALPGPGAGEHPGAILTA